MAASFIGLHVQVVLRQPEGHVLRGTVDDIAAGANLTLVNVFAEGSNQTYARLTIAAENVADLREVEAEAPPIPFTGLHPVPAPEAMPASSSLAPSLPFEDPAIMSMGKSHKPPPLGPAADVHVQASASTSANANAKSNEKRDLQPGQPGVLPAPNLARRTESPSVPSATTALPSLNLDGSMAAGPANAGGPDTGTQDTSLKKKRKPRQHRGSRGAHDENWDSPNRPQQGGRGKGWRQTPILQSPPTFQPFNSLKRNGKGREASANNGWASEDVTEEMAPFDFEGSLAKFDKRTIFDQMRKEDQVDDANRLVSHNRRPKPGTSGGKNFAPTESVLQGAATSAKPANDFWNSEADDGVQGAERLGGRDVRSQQSNRRADSKPGTARRSQSRKANAAGHGIARVSSGLDLQAGFYTRPSNRRIDPVSALQMLNLENIAANEIGLTEDMMTENAARGIAEVAFIALSEPSISLRLDLPANSVPGRPNGTGTVVVLAGNNKSGIRAMAAARHLRNKNVNVLLCLVGVERERDLLEDMKQQARTYRNTGGRVFSKHELFEYLRKASSTTTPVVTTLIIDALLGLTISFEELRTGDQATVYELIEWANRNEALVLALDVPTGIDPTNGTVSIIDGTKLFVKPKYVVCLGAPKRGLFQAIEASHETAEADGEARSDGLLPVADDDDEWKLYIADMGFGSSVWRKAGTKQRRGIDFDQKWLLEMRYHGGGADTE